LASICSRHTACVPISTFSQVTQWLASIREKSDEYENVANTLKRTLQEIENELEELKLENASANELVDVLKADSKDMQKQQIQEWHSRNMQLRIKVCVLS
jgi:DNA-binding ferritin-like protein